MQPIDLAQRKLIEQLVPIAESESIPLEAALGRFLAEDVYTEHDVPPSDTSLFDGYALKAPSPFGSSRRVVGVTYAGDAPGALPDGDHVWRIFTGAPLPTGANAVIAQESVVRSSDETVVLNEAMSVGAGVRLKGADSRRGQQVLAAGVRLDPPQLGLLASVG